jgi:ribosomal-protein-alanine N-acetyltransferase
MKTIIETERLYLREILPEDVEGMFEMDSDPEVQRFLGRTPVKTLEKSMAIIENIRQQYVDFGVARLAIIEKSSGDFVGWGGLKLITESMNGFQDFHDLGYRFIKRYWGQGYAQESSRGVIKYAFEQLNLPAIYAIADLEHKASRNVLEKCGFCFVNSFEYDGDPHAWYTMQQPTY